MRTVRRVLADAPLSWLLFAVPIAAWMHHARPDAPLLVFGLACVAIVPLAGLLGAAFLAGGLRYKIQSFATIGVRTQIGMMALAAIAILVPSVFAATGSGEMASRSVAFSVVVSAVLLVVYALSLLFLLRTHADLFRGEEPAPGEAQGGDLRDGRRRPLPAPTFFTSPS